MAGLRIIMMGGGGGSAAGALNYQGVWDATTNTPTLVSGMGTKGYYYVVSVDGTTSIDGIAVWNVGDWIVFNGTAWNKLDGVASEVISVAGRTGAVTLVENDVANLVSDLATKAPVASPTFTGTPAAPTAAPGTNTTQLASTAFVAAAITAIPAAPVSSVAGRTGAIVIAESDVTNLVADLAAKAPAASPTLTGTPIAPTATGGTNNTQIATTAFVQSAIPVTTVAGRTGAIVIAEGDVTNLVSDLALKSTIASPTFTGTPAAPTAAPGTNTTQLASTAFVTAAVAAVPAAPVTSVAGRTGAVTLAVADVTNAESTANKNASNGYCPLDSGSKVPSANLNQAIAATASTLAARDASGNLSINNALEGYTSTATAAGTTTLVVGSTYTQIFTGSANQIIALPVVSTLVLGQKFHIINNATAGNLTVNSSGGNFVTNIPFGMSAIVECILVTGTTAASWTVPQPVGLCPPLADYYVDGTTLSGTETDLQTLTIPAGQLSTNGDKIKGEYGGTYVYTGGNGQFFRIYFAGTKIFDSGSISAINNYTWIAYVTIIRASSTSVRYMVNLLLAYSSNYVTNAVGTVTGLTLTNTQVLKITGQQASGGAIACTIGDVVYQPHT